MSLYDYLKYILICLVLILSQIFVFDLIHLNGYGKIMPYPLAILLLPHRFKHVFVIIIAFVIGFILDFSLNTGGLHAASLTLLAYLRGYLLNILKPTTESTDNSFISLKNTNLGWFLIYTFILLLVQQSSYYLFESFTLNNLTFILKKTMVGSISSTFVILLILLLFKNTAKNRN